MSRSRANRGQALVEFALIVPLFLTLLVAVVDFGRVVWANDTLANAAREGARFAIVHGGSKSTACPVGPPVTGVTVVPSASPSCPNPSPSKQSIIDVASAFSVAGGSPLTVDVCYGLACTGSTDAVGATNARGTPVTVTVTSEVDLVTGQFLGRGQFVLSAKTTMLVNH